MSNTATRSRLAGPKLGGPTRSRDTESPSAPIRVTEYAQAKAVDIYKAKQFGFSRIDHNKLPERPNTSGGPSSKRRNAERRETKDDLHFNDLGNYSTGTTFYNFPLPGSLPIASRTSFAPIRNSSLHRAATQDSMDTARYMGIPQNEIGLALGSPTHQPLGWHPPASFIPSARNETPDSIDTYLDSSSHVSVVSKQRASRWKIFGGLFGGNKKGTGLPQAFYQLQPESAVVQTKEDATSVNFGEPVPSTSRRSKSQPRNKERLKPNLKRSETAPQNFDFQRSRGKPITETPTITLDRSHLATQPNPKQSQEGSLLQVDIPSVAMERYSIMFGSVLQTPAPSSSSLLARRQATLDRLKNVNEKLALKEQELNEKEKHLMPRRATSPQVMRSPVFSLFPTTLSGQSVREGSPSINRHALQRSNTSPAALSPSRPNFPSFATDFSDKAHASLIAPGPHIPVVSQPQVGLRSLEQEPRLISEQAALVQPSSQPSTRNGSLEELNLTLDSAISDDEGEEVVYNTAHFPIKPKLSEPTWQILTPHHAPTSSISGSISSASDHSASTSASSMSITTIATFTSSHVKTVEIQAPPQKLRSRSSTASSTITQPQQRYPQAQSTTVHPRRKGSQTWFSSPPPSLHGQTKHEFDSEDIEARLKTAAEISIARQISVSHQQRELLVLMKAKSSPNLKSQPNLDVPAPLKIAKLNRGPSTE